MKVKQEFQEIKESLDNLIVNVESVNQANNEIKKMLSDLKEAKEKFDAGKTSKFIFLKSIDANKERLAKLTDKKKEITKKVFAQSKETNELLEKIKQVYSLRVKMDGIGKIK